VDCILRWGLEAPNCQTSQDGRTVLFVSHNLGAINQLCGRVVWLSSGEAVLISSAAEVVRRYLKEGQNVAAERWWPAPSKLNAELVLRGVRVCQPPGHPSSVLDIAHSFEVEIYTEALKPVEDVSISVQIINTTGQIVLHSAGITNSHIERRHVGTRTIVCRIPAHALNIGDYKFAVAADVPNVRVLFVEDDTISWTVGPIDAKVTRY
jgi:lipopolysaccharide transport system ATP-binding protein